MTPERKAELRDVSENGVVETGHITELLDALDAAEAQAASLRAKLQHARGALYFFRAPGDVNKPTSEWNWNVDAVRDIHAHCDLPSLLDRTQLDGPDEGLALLVQLEDLTEKVAVLDRDLKSASQAFDIESHRVEQIAKYVNADGYVDSIGPILDAIDSLRAKVDSQAELAEEETHG